MASDEKIESLLESLEMYLEQLSSRMGLLVSLTLDNTKANLSHIAPPKLASHDSRKAKIMAALID